LKRSLQEEKKWNFTSRFWSYLGQPYNNQQGYGQVDVKGLIQQVKQVERNFGGSPNCSFTNYDAENAIKFSSFVVNLKENVMFRCIILFTTSVDLGNHIWGHLEMTARYLRMVILTVI